MGAAFLLLETKSVVQFALLFGTTWFVNALVFGGVLLSVLLAIEVAKRTQPNPKVLYGVLAVTIAIAFVAPESALLQLAVVPRFLVAVAIAFGPVFCANLVFAERFEMAERPTVAFGANLWERCSAERSSTPRSSPGTELSSSPRRFLRTGVPLGTSVPGRALNRAHTGRREGLSGPASRLRVPRSPATPHSVARTDRRYLGRCQPR